MLPVVVVLAAIATQLSANRQAAAIAPKTN